MKVQILKFIENELEKHLVDAKKVYTESLKLTQSGDLKSDGKYDTRAIEAGYLTSAQKARVAELENQITIIQRMIPQTCTQVTIGSLVQVNGKWYFFTKLTGGIKFEVDGKLINIVSTQSPLWDACCDLEVDDDFELDEKEYVIESLS
jgi:transcription elongation GreA/GreB family factor